MGLAEIGRALGAPSFGVSAKTLVHMRRRRFLSYSCRLASCRLGADHVGRGVDERLLRRSSRLQVKFIPFVQSSSLLEELKKSLRVEQLGVVAERWPRSWCGSLSRFFEPGRLFLRVGFAHFEGTLV